MNPRPVIVISATRFFQGGTLVIVNECLKFLSTQYCSTHHIKALVYKKGLYDDIPGVDWVEFPNSRKSFFNRLSDEYIRFNRLSKKWRPILWLSLQDSTPRVKADIKAVYYHNPLLLKPKGLKLWKYQPRLAVLRLLYKYIYTKGIDTNDFVITQQPAIAAYLLKTYHLSKDKVWVFPPVDYLIEKKTLERDTLIPPDKPYTFIFPATAFYYKNHALIIEACGLLSEINLDFKVLLTIDGSENNYVQNLVSRAKEHFPQIEFLGFMSREKLFTYYQAADCMIFPSFLESWGLPLTEFAGFDKPILCADLPYGKSTLAGYKKAAFFDPVNALTLAAKMEDAIRGKLRFKAANLGDPDLFSQRTMWSWAECFALLLSRDQDA